MKVLWGFAPLQQDNLAIKGMFKSIRQFSPDTKNISVGCVVSESDSYLSTAFDVPAKERYSTYPKKLILGELKKANALVDDNRIQVVQQKGFTTTKAVDRLLEVAKSQKADLLALFTHNKTGLKRFFLGSFAETAIHRSPIDLLIVNPKSEIPQNIKNIIFASDFSDRSKKDLEQVLELCESLGARLTVFHAAEVTYSWSPDEDNSEILAYRKKTDRMAQWVREACQKKGVSCEVILKSEFKPTSELILKAAQKVKAQLIIVSAETGPAAALMGGSVTRQIVRNGKYPVLVIKRRKGKRS